MRQKLLAAFLTFGALGAGCSAEGPPRSPAAQEALPPGVEEALDPDIKGGIALESRGLIAVTNEGARTNIPFGTPMDELKSQVEPLIGPATSEALVADCGTTAGPVQIAWDGMTLLARDGLFAGWEATDGGYAVIDKQGEVTIGQSLSQVTNVLGPLELKKTTRGYEFVIEAGPGATEYAGVFASEDPSAALEGFTAGLNCYID